ncbi:MAG: hypothetical protein AAF810_07085 [Cyanobacteria bacterium P01_D01_bin.36]
MQFHEELIQCEEWIALIEDWQQGKGTAVVPVGAASTHQREHNGASFSQPPMATHSCIQGGTIERLKRVYSSYG